MKVNWNTALNAIAACAAILIAVILLLALRFAQHEATQFEHLDGIRNLDSRIAEYESARFTGIRRSLASQRIDPANQRLRQYDPDNPPDPLIDELNFCDDLGLLVYRGAVNRHDVWDVFGDWLFILNRDAQPAIDAARRREGASIFGDCTDLVESLNDIEVAENGNPRMIHPGDDAIYRFYLSETNAQPGEPPNNARFKLRQKDK